MDVKFVLVGLSSYIINQLLSGSADEIFFIMSVKNPDFKVGDVIKTFDVGPFASVHFMVESMSFCPMSEINDRLLIHKIGVGNLSNVINPLCHRVKVKYLPQS